MSLKLKSGDLSVKIPTLTDESNFRVWDRALKNYLGSASLEKYILYDIKDPYQLEDEDIEYLRMPEVTVKLNGYTKIKRIPTELKRIVANSESTKIYTKTKPKEIPGKFIEDVIDADIILINEKELYFLYDDLTKFLEASSKRYKENVKVKTLINTSLTQNIQSIISEEEDVYKVYQKLTEKFQKDVKIELKNIRNKFRKIKCKNLLKYIQKFEEAMSLYVTAGGKRDENTIYDSFLENIKHNRYKNVKQFYDGNNIDVPFFYFRKHAFTLDEEEIQEDEEEVEEVLKINKASISNQRSKFCTKCDGRGHSRNICSNTHDACHYRGKEGHMKASCPFTRNKRRYKARRL